MEDLNSLLPDPRHQRLVEWLTTPKAERRPQHQKGLAEEFGVSERTIRDWKGRQDVRKAWEKIGQEIIGDPDNVFDVVEEMRLLAMDKTAKDADRIRAANLYLEVAEAIKPPEQTVNVVDKRDWDKFTDAELDALIAQEMAKQNHFTSGDSR